MLYAVRLELSVYKQLSMLVPLSVADLICKYTFIYRYALKIFTSKERVRQILLTDAFTFLNSKFKRVVAQVRNVEKFFLRKCQFHNINLHMNIIRF